MAETTATSPRTIAVDTTVGTRPWSSPDNAKTDDAAAAQSSAFGAGTNSNYLKATNFGFEIPSRATIDGILVEVKRRSSNQSSTQYIVDNEVRIVKEDGSIGLTNKADTTTKYPTSEAYVDYGSLSDVWGETWTAENINDSDFGFAFSINIVQDSGLTIAAVFHIRMTIYYTESTFNPAFAHRRLLL